ncbi:hypothetical protein GCK32_013993 [Trichostrongylus colubriformis]|uniref:Uncharacterized protein n=1 Tax=Trichostrongylus colubriformis TaxID=6319 RepID=A0AAN8FBI0_TRICO
MPSHQRCATTFMLPATFARCCSLNDLSCESDVIRKLGHFSDDLPFNAPLFRCVRGSNDTWASRSTRTTRAARTIDPYGRSWSASVVVIVADHHFRTKGGRPGRHCPVRLCFCRPRPHATSR